MEKRVRVLLLKYLEMDGDITNVEKFGYSYATIAKEYSRLINEEMIVSDNNCHFILSEKGKRELNRLYTEVYKDKRVIIEPYAKYKIERLGKYDIYIE